MKSILAAAAIAVTVTSATADTITDSFSSFYVLGDSLSDNGNLFAPFWAAATGGAPFAGNLVDGGTFTNGDVWNESIIVDFESAGHNAGNFAVGGAATTGGNFFVPDLGQQIVQLLTGTTALERGPDPLVSIWFGANDLFAAISAGTGLSVAVEAANRILDGALVLAAAGVNDFLMFNLPDLGSTPRYALFDPANAAAASLATAEFNMQLADNIAILEGSGYNVIDIDVATIFTHILAEPTTFGFTETSLPCVFPSELSALLVGQPTRCGGSVVYDRLFIDAVHPSVGAHDLITAVVIDEIEADLLAPVPLPATAPLLVIALGCFGWASRRRLAA